LIFVFLPTAGEEKRSDTTVMNLAQNPNFFFCPGLGFLTNTWQTIYSKAEISDLEQPSQFILSWQNSYLFGLVNASPKDYSEALYTL